MSICIKCWNDAYSRALQHPSKTQTECYMELLEERKNNPCSKEEQQETTDEETAQ